MPSLSSPTGTVFLTCLCPCLCLFGGEVTLAHARRQSGFIDRRRAAGRAGGGARALRVHLPAGRRTRGGRGPSPPSPRRLSLAPPAPRAPSPAANSPPPLRPPPPPPAARR